MADIFLAAILTPRLREFHSEEEIRTIESILRDQYHERNRKKGELRRIGPISLSENLVSEYRGNRRISEGFFQQSVSVKQFASEPGKLEAEKEIIQSLEEKDSCIRSLCSIDDGQNCYMVMEPCLCTLEELIRFKNEDATRLKDVLPEDLQLYNGERPRPQIIKIISELIDEMTTRHSIGLGHTELNPQLVFLAMEAKPTSDGPDMAPLCVRLYDYDKCQKECKYADVMHNQNDSTISPDLFGPFNEWTDMWKSPEQLKGDEIASLSSDMFVLGLVFHYALTNGRHPFDRPYSIIADEPDFQWVVKCCPEAPHLIRILLQKEPHQRGNIRQLRKHPIFWQGRTKIQFMLRAHERLLFEHERLLLEHKTSPNQSSPNQSSPLLTDMEANKTDIIGTEWKTKIETMVSRKMGAFDTHLVSELLRFIRHCMSHFIKDRILMEPKAAIYDTAAKLFEDKFPKLFMEVYTVFSKHCSTEPYFREYF